jgi:hypothetical protein
VRHIGRDVEKVSGASDKVLFQLVAVPHTGFPANDMESRFVSFVLVRLGRTPCGYSDNLQVNFPRPHGFRRNRRCA